MFKILKKDAIRLLEVELERLKELLSDVNINKTFEWGLDICPVCETAANITGTERIRSRKMCKVCILFGVQSRCHEIETMRDDAIFVAADEMSKDDVDYFKRVFPELIEAVENQLLQVKFDELDSYTIVAII